MRIRAKTLKPGDHPGTFMPRAAYVNSEFSKCRGNCFSHSAQTVLLKGLAGSPKCNATRAQPSRFNFRRKCGKFYPDSQKMNNCNSSFNSGYEVSPVMASVIFRIIASRRLLRNLAIYCPSCVIHYVDGNPF